MLERWKIIGRIREALVLTAPHPGHAHPQEPASTGGMEAAAPGVGAWLPAVGERFEDQVEMFRVQSAELRSEFQLLDSREEALAALAGLAKGEGWERIATHAGAHVLPACSSLGLPVLRTDQPYEAVELEKCAAGITECDFLIAQTGSVVVSARSAGGRALSVLPPHHVVLARREQLVRDLPAAFTALKGKYGASYPSFLSIITGPSRTGDIERILVLGAHGPKKLTVLCW